jgi:hypothetical protein
MAGVGRYAIAIFLAGCLALLAGCGSGTSSIVPVQRAADVTARLPGYRIAATMNVTTPVVGSMQMSMHGVYARATRSGRITGSESLAGRQFRFTELFSGLTFYLRASGLPQLNKLTAGRPWLEFDMSRMLGAMGVGALPTGSDPSQFVDYLRAVSASTGRKGHQTIRGVPTTRYHAVVNLDRYTALVPRGQRASAQRGIRTLESALGSHTMPIDVWIDRSNLVRRVHFSMAECIAGQRMHFDMTMDLFDYGPQAAPQVPSAARAYNITPLISSSLTKVKFGCTAA